MYSVDKINISDARALPEDTGTACGTSKCVGGGVIQPHVGFRLDYTPGDYTGRGAMTEQAAYKFESHQDNRLIIKLQG
jgi:hypothetical protein